MDTASGEDLAGRLVWPAHQAQRPTARRSGPRLHGVIDVGEHSLALEGIAGMLARAKVATTDQERGDMLALSARMNAEGDAVRRALESCPRADTVGPGQERS